MRNAAFSNKRLTAQKNYLLHKRSDRKFKVINFVMFFCYIQWYNVPDFPVGNIFYVSFSEKAGFGST